MAHRVYSYTYTQCTGGGRKTTDSTMATSAIIEKLYPGSIHVRAMIRTCTLESEPINIQSWGWSYSTESVHNHNVIWESVNWTGLK